VLADPTTSRAVATIVQGRIAHLTADGSARLAPTASVQTR